MKPSEKLTVEDILDFEENNRKECIHHKMDFIGFWNGTNGEDPCKYRLYKCSVCGKIKHYVAVDRKFTCK